MPPKVLVALLALLLAAPLASSQSSDDDGVGYAYAGAQASGVIDPPVFVTCWSAGRGSLLETSSDACGGGTRANVVNAEALVPGEVIVGFVLADTEVCVMAYKWGVQRCTLCEEYDGGEELRCLPPPPLRP